ncbi:TetR/AcrR family transcriptional regulator [Novosphingobium beihaiensis]|uniref:TetR/AcrR family transcriptional regulator n=1 Tax=Novosphingobium beihaiensis TaxID=2930389 RepID=A0ABT0BKA9_9SPHN|nr:TetR/AcrR family transcriptional regulator [Novosphingobium beihaiensis]MCJ2185496.1 TetR/AcrR family transcriptional regulator [Novosphingobium beihaiensis]
MNDTKKIGRPRNFDYGEALVQAMSVFWTKGYDGASLRDLTQAMGITGPSLYAAFGDKRELYLKTIDHYCNADACAPIVAFEGEDDIEKAIHDFLAEVIRSATEHASGAKGCFLASCVVTTVGQVDGVAERVEAAIDDTEQRLVARFECEIEKGTLPPDFPSRERAALLFDIRQGYMFRGRAGWNKDRMQKDIGARVRMVLSH